MVLTSNLRVNGDRLWDSLMEMAKIGPGLRAATIARP
ncbi:beta-ureidopropionase [Brucella suis]|nr:beta-ureidopropionase [Brucella suis]